MKHFVLLIIGMITLGCATQYPGYSPKDFDGKCNTIIAGISHLPKYDFKEIYPIYVPRFNYPRVAAKRKVEGFAVIVMDVEVDGSVKNVRLAEACPGGYFES